MTSITLSGFAPTVTFNENTVNATPQLLDADVDFTATDDNFNGGKLVLSGLAGEDLLSIRNQGTAAGEIGLQGSDVTFGGVAIGTVTGSLTSTLTVTFNADATAVAIDALIQNLTYANLSDAPTAERDLVINVTDASGASPRSGTPGTPDTFAQVTGSANPLDGLYLGFNIRVTTGDYDGDGDDDLLFTDNIDANLQFMRNDGNGVFTQVTGPEDPFAGTFITRAGRPAMVDFDADGDLDIVVGINDGTLAAYANIGAGQFSLLSAGANPFNGISAVFGSTPDFIDLDQDGDLDLVVSGSSSPTRTFENNGSFGFTEWTTLGTGLNFPIFQAYTWPDYTAVDIDGDGDQDLVWGESLGTVRVFRNDGPLSGVELIGSANPFDAIVMGSNSSIAFIDLDGDGDKDAVVTDKFGTINSYLNTTTHGATVHVTVTGENDAPTATGLPATMTVTEETASPLDLSALFLADAEDDMVALRIDASVGSLSAAKEAGILILSTGSTLMLYGDANALSHYLHGTNVTYTGSTNLSGDGVAQLTFYGNDGDDQSLFGTISVNITDTVDTLTGTTGDDNLTGTQGADSLQGLDGNDLITGHAGADTMDGGAGVDKLSYRGSRQGVVVDLNTYGTGFQLADGGDATGDVVTGFENVRGSNFDDVLTGDAAKNILYGAAGDDAFEFKAALGGGNIDKIADYTVGEDTILLSSSIFTALPLLPLSAEAFAANDTGFATTADQRIIYETDTGRLYYDTNGSAAGQRVCFGILTAGLTLSEADFLVV